MKKKIKSSRIILLLITLAFISVLVVILFPHTAQSTRTIEKSVIVEVRDPLLDHAVAIADSIALVESGDSLDCSKIGQNGERGCHQFLPTTWAAYSKDVYGEVLPQTAERAEHVAVQKIYSWLKQGYTDRQIFLLWNSGQTVRCSKGVNSKGVKYDSCAYVEKGLAKLALIKAAPTL